MICRCIYWYTYEQEHIMTLTLAPGMNHSTFCSTCQNRKTRLVLAANLNKSNHFHIIALHINNYNYEHLIYQLSDIFLQLCHFTTFSFCGSKSFVVTYIDVITTINGSRITLGFILSFFRTRCRL